MSAEQQFDAATKLACVRRELSMRERLYPRWVEAGKMSQAMADQNLAVMRAIVTDYARAAEGERLL